MLPTKMSTYIALLYVCNAQLFVDFDDTPKNKVAVSIEDNTVGVTLDDDIDDLDGLVEISEDDATDDLDGLVEMTEDDATDDLEGLVEMTEDNTDSDDRSDISESETEAFETVPRGGVLW